MKGPPLELEYDGKFLLLEGSGGYLFPEDTFTPVALRKKRRKRTRTSSKSSSPKTPRRPKRQKKQDQKKRRRVDSMIRNFFKGLF